MRLGRTKRADVIVLGILLPLAGLGAVLTWLLTPPEKTGGMSRQPSSYFNRGYGTKAAYLVLERLDFNVVRLRRLITPNRLARYRALVILQPTVSLSEQEVEVLKAWIKGGGNLLLVPSDSLGVDPMTSWVIGGQYRSIDLDYPNFKPGSWTPAQATSPANDAAEETWFDATDPLWAGVSTLAGGTQYRFEKHTGRSYTEPAAPVHEIWTDAHGVVALRMQWGSGTIIALADPYPLSNVGLTQADNIALLANLASLLSGNSSGTIAFDEFHHGFVHTESFRTAVTKMVLGDTWAWAICQALLAGALALLAAGIRFGRPEDIVHRPRRRHGEFARAAGQLLYDARAHGHIYRTLYAEYRMRLCRAVQVSPKVNDAILAARIAERGVGEAAHILPRATERTENVKISPDQVLKLTRQMHEMLEKLEHGT